MPIELPGHGESAKPDAPAARRVAARTPDETARGAAAAGLRALALPTTPGDIAALVLILCLASPIWIESDIYRFAAVALVAGALWLRRPDPEAPAWGAMAWICCLWAAYAGLRYGLTMTLQPDATGGSSEGIYLFPLLYASLGLAFLQRRHLMMPVAAGVVVVSLVLLAVSIQPGEAVSMDRAHFLFHRNTIHASVGGGFVLFAAVCFGLHAAAGGMAGRARQAAMALAVAVAGLALFGILGAQSRGVWIAFVATLPVLAALILVHEPSSAARAGLVALIALAALFVAVFVEQIGEAVGPSYASGMELMAMIAGADDRAEAVRALIASGSVPDNFNDRLMLWYNAVEIWSQNILFGTGVYWENLWQQTHYADVGYEIVHNGFLEVLMRYGLLGLAFYALLTVWAIAQARACLRRGLIGRYLYIFYLVATFYFFVTLLTNSNIRLAIGEAFMLCAAGFGFCCHYLLARHDNGPEARRSVSA